MSLQTSESEEEPRRKPVSSRAEEPSESESSDSDREEESPVKTVRSSVKRKESSEQGEITAAGLIHATSHRVTLFSVLP